ncbi:MAG: 5-formyltetrahydrofolate cyclo-ligase, partial [Bacteroidia bacterium]
MQKKEIRKEIKQLKAQYTLAEKKALSAAIFKQVEALPQFQAAKTVMLYWSMDDEVFTHDFVCKWAADKQV